MCEEYNYQLELFVGQNHKKNGKIQATKKILKEIWKESWDMNSRLGDIWATAEFGLKYFLLGRDKK